MGCPCTKKRGHTQVVSSSRAKAPASPVAVQEFLAKQSDTYPRESALVLGCSCWPLYCGWAKSWPFYRGWLRNPFRATFKPWLKPLFVGSYVGESNRKPGFLNGATVDGRNPAPTKPWNDSISLSTKQTVWFQPCF